MNPLLVVYASREGHTRKIAEHVAATIRARGDAVDVIDAAHFPEGFDLSRYDGVILAASIHGGKHEREMIAFVKDRSVALERVPTAFLSVSLTETDAEDVKAPPASRAKAAEQVKLTMEAFFKETGFHPRHVWPVAGALLFSQYGVLKRFVMKMIAKSADLDTDTSQDHEYTDWEALDRFVDAVVREVRVDSAIVEQSA